MSALSTSSIEKLIQPCKVPGSTENPNEKKPPLSFYPPLYVTHPIEPRTPITPTSPSPYVVNFKWRGPVKRANAIGDGDLQCEDPSEIDQSVGDEYAVIERTLPKSQENATSMHMPERNHSFEFEVSGFCEEDMAGSASETRLVLPHTRDASERPVLQSGADSAFKKMIAPFDNASLEIPYNDSTNFASGSDNSCFMSPRAFNSAEEFFDAPEPPFDDSASEDEVSSSTSLTPKMRGKSAEIVTPRVQQEIARRITAEEAAASLQRRWNEMARKCSLIGVPVTSVEDKLESKRHSIQDLYEQFSEKLVVARLVGGAVASAAVRAAKDEELESMVARKNLEISRLWDKLQYVELVNREMSQRNLEAMEITQRRKRRHRKRQKWVLGCCCSALCLGGTGLLCYKFLQWNKADAWSISLKDSAKLQHTRGE